MTGRSNHRRFVGRLALLTGVLFFSAACATLAGIDELEIGACKGGNCVEDAGVGERGVDPPLDGPSPVDDGGTLEAATHPCPPNTKGATMVRVGSVANNFCIDSTEVTVKQYREFTEATAGDAAGQSAECAWNTTYAAALGGADDIPIAGIDWCDAKAYCLWAGKRLCGMQVDDKFAGAVDNDNLINFQQHEWLSACTRQGQYLYPYGGAAHLPTACNTAEREAGGTVEVGSIPSCTGGYPGIFDMVGNLWEWFDGPCLPADAGPDGGDAGGRAKDECVVKGGAYVTSGPQIDCRVNGRGATRDRRGQEIGIRCCAD
ncbi:MAG: SUMF1/EgtB/PvdO family nonheme iron enzyme [Labilithrix sp.]|nr:SUMF1/EgtB/PvdO family nonheme iron enzyme [Labilithrix sp.]